MAHPTDTFAQHPEDSTRVVLLPSDFGPTVTRATNRLGWSIEQPGEHSLRANDGQASYIISHADDGTVAIHTADASSVPHAAQSALEQALRIAVGPTSQTAVASPVEEIFGPEPTLGADYDAPDTLPAPKADDRGSSPVAGFGIGVITAILLGALTAIAGFYLINVFIIFDYLIGIGLGAALGIAIQRTTLDSSNYWWSVIGTSAVVAIISQNFMYYLLTINSVGISMDMLSFGDYLSAILEEGLILGDAELGTTALVISWVVEVGIIFFVTWGAVAQRVQVDRKSVV